MNTNNIKSFAKQARLLLLEGVAQRLKFWGFKPDGSNDQSLSRTEGGYIFRGNIYTDVQTPKKWEALKKRIKTKEDIKDVIEEAAYVWFNRLMAIKILEQNGFIAPQLAFDGGQATPTLVQNAKRGNHNITAADEKALLTEYILEDKDEAAFGLLLADFCHRNRVIRDVFGRIDDYTEILIPQDLLTPDGVLSLINSNAIPEADYKEVELIGWLYQFYISDKKDEVFAGFKKNIKARAQDIPAATQIFTPKWIVKYMVENTIGKSYLDYNKDSDLKAGMKYLVESTEETASPSLINDITELTLIDPASGSGHILVTGFELLFDMYREEGYMASQAVEQILEHNLFGLDIDDRAMQLARFAVLLKAASYDRGILDKNIIPHVYSFPELQHFTTEDVQWFLGDDQRALADLHEDLKLLGKGKNLGSTMKLGVSVDQVAYLKTRYDYWKQQETQAGIGLYEQSVWNNLKPYLDVLLVLSKQYVAVVANPPYMGQKSMNADLKDYVNTQYPMTKGDLMTIFMEVIPALTLDKARFALINLPSWLFLSSFEKLRNQYIEDYKFDSLLHMGRGIFGIDFGSVAFTIKKENKTDAIGTYFKLHERNFQHVQYQDIEKLFLYSNKKDEYRYDFGQYRGDEGITEIPEGGTEKGLKLYYPNIPQTNFSKIPGSPIAYWFSNKSVALFKKGLLRNFAKPLLGMRTGDNQRFMRYWQEVSYLKLGLNQPSSSNFNGFKWVPYNKGGGLRKWYGLNNYIINWENNGFEIKENTLLVYPQLDWDNLGWKITNESYYFSGGITWTSMSSSFLSARYYGNGFIFDSKGPKLQSVDMNDRDYHLSYINSSVAAHFLKVLAPTLDFNTGPLGKLPYIETNKNDIEALTESSVGISRNDWDSLEISWDFEQSPLLNEATDLASAFSTWAQSAAADFFQLHANEEELNLIFIDIYGLQEELTPEVALKDITILQGELDRNALGNLEPTFRAEGKEAIELPIKKDEVLSQFVSYCMGLFFGRYRLDKKGLNIAHPNPTEEELSAYTYNGHNIEIDEDAIIPLMGEDCAFPDDALGRLKEVILAIWGEDSLTENINFLQECLGMDLHKWLTTQFWGYHTSMYKKKPIYWLFSSNPKKPQNAAFKVLVYMHRMDKFTVQKIQRKYLHPHQEFIKHEIERLSENEANLSKQEMKKLEQYRNWEIECRDYNEVLKELANQQIEIDLDDGVAANYPKFETAVATI
jgi:hypothetical protein